MGILLDAKKLFLSEKLFLVLLPSRLFCFSWLFLLVSALFFEIRITSLYMSQLMS